MYNIRCCVFMQWGTVGELRIRMSLKRVDERNVCDVTPLSFFLFSHLQFPTGKKILSPFFPQTRDLQQHNSHTNFSFSLGVI